MDNVIYFKKESKQSKNIKAYNIANYFLTLVSREAGDAITLLKLQQLLYFAQGASLVLFNKPLFNNQIIAWYDGVKINGLQNSFNSASSVLPIPDEISFNLYKKQEKQLIYKIYSTYGEKTAASLRKVIIRSDIWKEAISTENRMIEQDKLKKHFASIIQPDFLILTDEDKENIEIAENTWYLKDILLP